MYGRFEENKYCYFSIYDELDELVENQTALISPEKAAGKLRDFVNNHEGVFSVYALKKPTKGSLAERALHTQAKFTIDATRPALPAGMSGATPAQNGPSSHMTTVPSPYEGGPNSWQLVGQVGTLETEMKLMRKDHEHYREMQALQDRITRMEEEQNKSRGMGAIVDRVSEQFSDPAVIMGLISGIKQLFNKQPEYAQQPQRVPINGVKPIDAQVKKNVNDRSETLARAINSLVESDPDFAENMQKLAILAKAKPDVYKMAIGYLNNL
jgi:hypothetical protein